MSKDNKQEKKTIGAVAVAALTAGKSPQEALDAVLKEFPEANTKMASIYWYASKNDIDLAERRRKTPREDKPKTKVVKASETAKAATPAAKKKVGPLTTKGKGRTLAPKGEQAEAAQEAKAS